MAAGLQPEVTGTTMLPLAQHPVRPADVAFHMAHGGIYGLHGIDVALKAMNDEASPT